jgi:thioredoxin 1
MKSFKFILCIAVGITLMISTNSCENKKKAETQSGSQSESTVNIKSDNSKSDASDKLVLIDFYATWCGPCKAMAPVMEQLEKKYGDRIEFKKVDVDQNEELALKYKVESIPNIVILSPDDEVLENIIGYHDANDMDEILSKVLDK